jgi:hypothetical protein
MFSNLMLWKASRNKDAIKNGSRERSLRYVLFCAEIMLKLGAVTFFLPPTPNLSNLLIEASIYYCLYALNEELKGYPVLL